MSSFVHLHTHSAYSLLDGLSSIPSLLDRCKELGMDRLALTDHGNLFGAVEFYYEAKQRGIKPIIGCETYLNPVNRHVKSGGKPVQNHLVLLAENYEGYRNLIRIVSRSHLEGFYYKPQIDEELLREHSGGLIALTGCMSGVLSRHLLLGDEDGAREQAGRLAEIFGRDRLFVELQYQGIGADLDGGLGQLELNAALASLADSMGLGIVATNDIHYVRKEDWHFQDLLLCVQTGRKLDEQDRMRFKTEEFYMKSPEEMREALPAYPEALANTSGIADMCNVELEIGKIILPHYKTQEGMDEDGELRRLARQGLQERYGEPMPRAVEERFEHEMGLITSKGLSSYFLIVADFIRWSRENGIRVGPGRGSAAGSIVSYSLHITDLDPLAYGLIFERFLHPERTEMPDIDIDFPDDRRADVIGYVRSKYGEDRVCQTISFQTLKARAAVKRAAQVLDKPYALGDKISKLVPYKPGVDLRTQEEQAAGLKELDIALRDVKELRKLYNEDPEVKQVIDDAIGIEGCTGFEGVHAAAVVISPEPLQELIPVKMDKRDESVITQFDGGTIARLGLLKMDFLGLRTLSVITGAVRLVEETKGIELDMDSIPLDDGKTFEMLRAAETDCVFQLESPGMKRALRQVRPTTLSDIQAVVALYRPGPMENIPLFAERKHGRQETQFYHDDLKEILGETYGVIVYQEQAMSIAMKLAGFSPAKSEELRYAIGKKKAALMAKLKVEFFAGAEEKGYDSALVQRVWDDMESFAQYAFNKSHAAAYGLLAYQTAYLKAHHPVEFMAAELTSYHGNAKKLPGPLAACRTAGIRVLPPDVNVSAADFKPVEGDIRFGLASVKDIGLGLVQSLIAEREANGPYTSAVDFVRRVPRSSLNRRAMERLIKSGAFDTLGKTRRGLLEALDRIIESGTRRQLEKEMGQASLFGEETAEDDTATDYIEISDEEFDKDELLFHEKESLGIFATAHPLERVASLLYDLNEFRFDEAEEVQDGRRFTLTGLITDLEVKRNRNKDNYATFALDDMTGTVDVIVLVKLFNEFGELLKPDMLVTVRGLSEQTEKDGLLIRAESVEPFIPDAEMSRARITIKLKGEHGEDELSHLREAVWSEPEGSTEVIIDVETPFGRATMRAGRRIYLAAAGSFVAHLRELLGDDNVAVQVSQDARAGKAG